MQASSQQNRSTENSRTREQKSKCPTLATFHAPTSRRWETRVLWEKQNGRGKREPRGRIKIDLNFPKRVLLKSRNAQWANMTGRDSLQKSIALGAGVGGSYKGREMYPLESGWYGGKKSEEEKVLGLRARGEQRNHHTIPPLFPFQKSHPSTKPYRGIVTQEVPSSEESGKSRSRVNLENRLTMCHTTWSQRTL